MLIKIRILKTIGNSYYTCAMYIKLVNVVTRITSPTMASAWLIIFLVIVYY